MVYVKMMKVGLYSMHSSVKLLQLNAFPCKCILSYQRTGDIVMLVSWQSLPLVKAATSKWKLYYLTLLTLYCLSLRTNILA